MYNNRRFEDNGKPPIFGARHLQCLLLFWGIMIADCMRFNLPYTINTIIEEKPTSQGSSEYAWSLKEEIRILNSFFWGYVSTQILGGYLARIFGGKMCILVGISMCSVLTILTPTCTDFRGSITLVCVNFMQGMCQGILFPANHTLLAKWAPENERAILGTYCYSGSQLGRVAMIVASGFIASSPLGWPAVFYISGGCGIIWVFVWYSWGASTPDDYTSISPAEKNLIEASLSHGKETTRIPAKILRTPWVKILTSPPFLALMLTHCGFTFGFSVILSHIPLFMKIYFAFEISRSGLVAALPHLVMFILGLLFAIIARWMDKRKCLSLSQSRKLFNSISTLVPAVALVCVGYANSTQTVLILFIIAVGFSAAMHLGFEINYIDLSPNFAGIMLGFGTSIAYIITYLLSNFVNVSDWENLVEWRNFFFIFAGVYFITNLLFVIFGEARVQSWNEPRRNEIEITNITSNL